MEYYVAAKIMSYGITVEAGEDSTAANTFL